MLSGMKNMKSRLLSVISSSAAAIMLRKPGFANAGSWSMQVSREVPRQAIALGM